MIVSNLEEAATLLNKLVRIDPEQISNFFNAHILVDKRCASTVFELGPSYYPEYAELYILGLLNGLLSEADEEGKIVRRLAIVTKPNSPIIERFVVENMQDRDDATALQEGR